MSFTLGHGTYRRSFHYRLQERHSREEGSRFEVVCGVIDGHLWCAVAEGLETRLHEETERFKVMFKTMVTAEGVELPVALGVSDRTAMASTLLPGVIFSASLRRRATTGSTCSRRWPRRAPRSA